MADSSGVVAQLIASADVRAADWVVVGVRGFGQSVLSLVPAGFPAYVRVFHPAYRGGSAGRTPVRWAEVAAANGRHAHSAMQLRALRASEREQDAQPGVYDEAPYEGELPREVAVPLVAVLARHTQTPDRCWFAIWYGFGGLPGEIRAAPTFVLPNREYHLLSGAVEAAAETALVPPWVSPNLWWPDDHAWCVATEIDLNSTYVACDEACAAEILARPELEALAIDPASGIDWRSDLVNPLD